MKKKGIFSASVIIPVVIGILFIVAMLVVNDGDNIEVEAAEFYEFKSIDLEKTDGLFQGTLANGTFVTIGDVINITAENSSTPTQSTDNLKIDIYVFEDGMEDYNVSFNLTYLGTGEDFWGKVTLDNNIGVDHQLIGDMLHLNVSDGQKVEVMKHKGDEPFFNFMVDTQKPMIMPLEPGTDIVRLKGEAYATTSAKINLIYMDSDDLATQTWAATNGKVKYKWDSGSEQTWDGTDFAVPVSTGTHILQVNATDRFDQYGNTSLTYEVTFTNSESEITDATSFINKTILSPTVRIKDGGSLDLINSTFILMGEGEQLIVYEDSYLNITGPTDLSADNSSMVYSSSGMTLRALPGSNFNMENTNVTDSSGSSTSPKMELYTGNIQNSIVKGPNDLVMIRDIGVIINDTTFTGMEADHGLIVDVNHTYDSSSTQIMNTLFNGSFKNPVKIVNNTVWKPYDVENIYTLGQGVFSIQTILPDLSGISDPAIYLPHFLDQRGGTSIFNVSYYDGADWVDLVSYSGVIFNDWLNGDEAWIDVGPLPLSSPIRMTWNNTDGDGSIYYGLPEIVGSNGMTATLFPVFSNWDDTMISSSTLMIDNMTLEDAQETFIDVENSGSLEIASLTTDSSGSLGAEYVVMVEMGEVTITDAVMSGDSNLVSFMKTDMDNENDFPVQRLEGVSMSIPDGEAYSGIHLMDSWGDLRNISIRNVSYGIDSEESLMNFIGVDVEATAFGVYMDLPQFYEEDVEMDLLKLEVSGDVQYSGFYMEGTPNYVLDITLGAFDMGSSYDDSTYVRSDGYGQITIDVESNEVDMLNIYGRLDSGPSHGMAFNSWSENGEVLINDTDISNMELDGVWMEVPLQMDLQNNDISLNDGWGFYGYEGANINISQSGLANSRFFNNDMGGLMIPDDTMIKIFDTAITQNRGNAVVIEEDVTALFNKVTSTYNNEGIEVGPGCTITFISSTVEYTTNGSGMDISDSNVIITGTQIERSSFSNNGGDGLFMDGGQLDIEYLDTNYNGGDGISLWSVDLTTAEDITTSFNQEAGFTAYVDDLSLVDMNNEYIELNNMKTEGNWGPGLTFSIDPTVINSPMEVSLGNFKSYGNRQGDISASKDIHFTWTFIGTGNKLGDTPYYGYTIANIDFISDIASLGSIINENLTFLNDDASFMVNEGGNLQIYDSYLRPLNPTHRWSIYADTGSRIEISGSYLGYMGMFEINDGRDVSLEGTQLSYGSNGLKIIGSDGFEIDSCQFTDINGFALNLESVGNGTIRGTGFRDNLRGIVINDVSGDLLIDDSTFIDNSWGMYIFTAQEDSSILIKNSEFEGNDLAPIWMSNTNITLQNTDIDPDAIIVNDLGHVASIHYTLTVRVLNEEENGQIFDIDVKVGSNAGNLVANKLDSSWSMTSRSYQVYRDTVDRSREELKISIKYEESTGSEIAYGYIFDSFILDSRMTKVYSGFEAPTTTGEFESDLEAYEDLGLKDGPVDISTWFTDIGRDKGNLSFSVYSIDPEITPILTGNILSIETQKDWNGDGKFAIKAVDPHGKELTVQITVIVIPRNDVPFITEPRIITEGGSDDVPRSGDTIVAVWTWNDIDLNDEEPNLKYIRWYLNGTLIEKYEGRDVRNTTYIDNVRSRQVWSFKAWPMDFYSLNYKEYGEPVMSPIALVQNVGPKWTSNLTYNMKNPTTDMDIIVSPGTFDDPDSSVVTYHYLWEVRWGDKYIPLGAPDSPILDSRFTSKGDDIRVKAWVSDGDSTSDIRIETFNIRNSKPIIVSVTVPLKINEKDTIITITDFATFDADGDRVTLYYYWNVGGSPIAVTPEIPQLSKVSGGWSYPGRTNITLTILPFDSENVAGDSMIIDILFEPTDTDGDGIYDDKNGNGINEEGDDKDDDNDGFEDTWEIFMGTDPKNPLLKPLDTDGDGRPNGNPHNTEIWMDRDDDEDGISDENDSSPTNGALPGDLDGDGIGNDVDQDIDGDLVLNHKDYDPYNPNVWSEPEQPTNLQGWILFLILLIIIVFIVVVVLIYFGVIVLPSNAPPGVADDGAEAIFEEDDDKPRKKREEELEEMEDLDNMSVCSVCGELVSLDLDKCTNCDAVFEELEDDMDMDEFDEELEEDED